MSGPAIVWFRRDLRLADHAALTAACARGRGVVPLFILDETVETLGPCAKWRLGLGVEALARSIEARGARLILRRGVALPVLRAVVAECGAEAVYWTHYPESGHLERDRLVADALRPQGVEVRVFGGTTLFRPEQVATGAGRPYAVFTAFWRAIRDRDPGPALPEPARVETPAVLPPSDRIDDWRMGAAMRRGAAVVRPYLQIGAAAAETRLAAFIGQKLAHYAEGRDFPGRDVTSGLSENLAWGEISPRRIWHAARAALDRPGLARGAEKFLSELGWREFAWHLLAHYPALARENWRRQWDAFPWRADNADAESWRRGMTGEPFVDAAMREMYVTGRMHNRARMIAASYLTKHLLTDWRVGLAWFQDCLADWDPAANAMGWQWVAGSGPDAAPYFRIFSPATQAERFDKDGGYRGRFLWDGSGAPTAEAPSYFAAVPKGWALDAGCPYPQAPVVGLAEGRARALRAHASFARGASS